MAYDLVLDLGAEFLRVQCKTGRLRDGAIVFNARSCRSNRSGTYVRSSTDEAPRRTASMLCRSVSPGCSRRRACA